MAPFKLSTGGAALLRVIEVVGRDEAAQDALFESQILLALTLHREGQEHRARETIRQTIRTFPNRRPRLTQFSPDVVELYDLTKTGMDREPRSQVLFTTQPARCTVVKDGRVLGHAPLQSDLYPGRYTIQIRCGDRESGIRRIAVVPGVQNIRFDLEADAALHPGPRPWIQDGPHTVRAAAELGRQLGAEKVYLVRRHNGGIRIEVVQSGQPRVLERGDGATASEALAGLVRLQAADPGEAPAGQRAAWWKDWAAWAGLGLGLASGAAGLALSLNARGDARSAFVADDPQDYFALATTARDRGSAGAMLLTSGVGLALGSITALIVPSSREEGIFHGPLFWSMAAAGTLAASLGTGFLLLDGCNYDDHGLCPAVLGEPLASNAPAGAALLLGGGAVVVAAILLRLVEHSGEPVRPRRGLHRTGRQSAAAPHWATAAPRARSRRRSRSVPRPRRPSREARRTH